MACLAEVDQLHGPARKQALVERAHADDPGREAPVAVAAEHLRQLHLRPGGNHPCNILGIRILEAESAPERQQPEHVQATRRGHQRTMEGIRDAVQVIHAAEIPPEGFRQAGFIVLQAPVEKRLRLFGQHLGLDKRQVGGDRLPHFHLERIDLRKGNRIHDRPAVLILPVLQQLTVIAARKRMVNDQD